MSEGNKSKRAGTATELQLFRKLRKADPGGQWESRTQGLDGKRTDTAPHGWDLFSRRRDIWVEVKLRDKRITWGEIRKWCEYIHERPCPRDGMDAKRIFPLRTVIYRQKHGSEWSVATPWMPFTRYGLMVYAEPFDQWLAIILTQGEV